MTETAPTLRERLEGIQIALYFAAVAAAAVLALMVPGTGILEHAITPALALMLFVTFLQVPLAELGRAFTDLRFLLTLLVANFVLIPLLAGALIQLLPPEPLLRLGVLLVLLAPCIDYVVTFAHLGRGDARLLLAATPVLLIVQMLLLPAYLRMFLGDAAAGLVQAAPFLHAFVWLIAVPLALGALMQFWAARPGTGARVTAALGLLPVPATALVLFLVVAAILPQIGLAGGSALHVLPLYIAFAVIAPVIGWATGRLFALPAPAGRAIAFSTATRNSLVILPLAMVVPGGMPLLPAVIVTQTLVELAAELIYIRVLGRLGSSPAGGKERA